MWFQLLWFLAVLGQESTQVWLVIAVVASVVFSYWQRDIHLRWLVGFVLCGIVLDSFNQYTGLFIFPTPWLPLWLLLLWGIFVWYAYQMRTILTHFPKFIVCIVGALGAAGSYYAGLKFAAVHWPYSTVITLVIVFVEWFCLLTAMIYSLNVLQKQGKGLDHEQNSD
ncbi:DUF2878 domain-containing protein [Vibrio rarus]|uniref:DUF2878 domain-containing protein n=1 Tax=Vibrio rarus TaxID=413403 RepID=UPI0021C29446|nr:DUF2878 domain-containing protein [Vibrio rarus]